MRLAPKVNGVWQYQDYTYTASGTPYAGFLPDHAHTRYPAGRFQRRPSVEPRFMHGVVLSVGTTGVGSKTSTTGIITAFSASVTIRHVLADSHMRLASKVNGVWQDQDYTYTASGVLTPAFLTTPTPGTQLAGSSVTFSWNRPSAPSSLVRRNHGGDRKTSPPPASSLLLPPA